MKPLHELDPVGRFSDRARDYVTYRPSYPPAAIDAILQGLGPPEQITAADVGAGTGISARLLSDRGVRVIAVEPGRGMREAASPHPNVEWADGMAEATGLPAQSVNLVLCAQSFHWFRPADTLIEFARILTANGRLSLMWNRRSKSDPLTAGYRQVIRDVGGETVVEQMEFDPGVIAASGLFLPPERLCFPNLQRLDRDGLTGRARSASYVPKDGPAGARLLDLLGSLHQQHADAEGFVTLVYDTEVWIAKRIPPTAPPIAP
jgi:SAM-dependent methyltransferase